MHQLHFTVNTVFSNNNSVKKEEVIRHIEREVEQEFSYLFKAYTN